jgi:hypothetical protein
MTQDEGTREISMPRLEAKLKRLAEQIERERRERDGLPPATPGFESGDHKPE